MHKSKASLQVSLQVVAFLSGFCRRDLSVEQIKTVDRIFTALMLNDIDLVNELLENSSPLVSFDRCVPPSNAAISDKQNRLEDVYISQYD
jgi:hypothetical protein